MYVHTVFIRIEAPGAKTNLRGMPLFKKIKVTIIIAADNESAHKEDLVYEPMIPGH